jgi:hypothetical protein
MPFMFPKAAAAADRYAPPAVGAVPDEVDAAEGLLHEAPREGLAPVVHAGEHRELVGAGPELGLRRVDRGLQVQQGAQPLDGTFAEQVAALDHFAHELFEGDGLPASCAAGADALHRRAHAQG